MTTETELKTVILPGLSKSITGTHEVPHKLVVDLVKFKDQIHQIWKGVFGRIPSVVVDRDVNEEGDFSIIVDHSYYIYLSEVEMGEKDMFIRNIPLDDAILGSGKKVLRLVVGAIHSIAATREDPEDCDEIDLAYSVTLSGVVSEMVIVETNRIMDNIWEGIQVEESIAEGNFPF
jgi:hypothetical protein